MLRTFDVGMDCVAIVGAGPETIKERFGLAATPGALHEERVLCGSGGAPYVMSDGCLQGHGLLDSAVRQELLVNLPRRLDKGGLAAPKAAVSLVLGDGAPHGLRKTVLNPLEVFLPLDGASHIHEDIAGCCIDFNAVPQPAGGGDRPDLELEEVQDAGTHGGRDRSHTCLVSVTVLLRMSRYRLCHVVLMEAIGRSAVSTNLSQGV